MTQRGLRQVVQWAAPVIGLALMAFYAWCDTACSALQGTLLGLDLRFLGIGFMAALLGLTLLERIRPALPIGPLRALLLAGALGGETLLVRFQVLHQIYCPFCLAFSLCIVALFLVHHRRRYGFLTLLGFGAGLALFALFFEGSVIPLYRLAFLRPIAWSSLGDGTIVSIPRFYTNLPEAWSESMWALG